MPPGKQTGCVTYRHFLANRSTGPTAKTIPGAHSSTRCSGSRGPSRSCRRSRSRSHLPVDDCHACHSPCPACPGPSPFHGLWNPFPPRTAPGDPSRSGWARTVHAEDVRDGPHWCQHGGAPLLLLFVLRGRCLTPARRACDGVRGCKCLKQCTNTGSPI